MAGRELSPRTDGRGEASVEAAGWFQQVCREWAAGEERRKGRERSGGEGGNEREGEGRRNHHRTRPSPGPRRSVQRRLQLCQSKRHLLSVSPNDTEGTTWEPAVEGVASASVRSCASPKQRFCSACGCFWRFHGFLSHTDALHPFLEFILARGARWWHSFIVLPAPAPFSSTIS